MDTDLQEIDAGESKVRNGRIGRIGLEVALSRQWEVMSVMDCSQSCSWGSQHFVFVLKESECQLDFKVRCIKRQSPLLFLGHVES